jgi:hypothetical protein
MKQTWHLKTIICCWGDGYYPLTKLEDLCAVYQAIGMIIILHTVQ